MNNNLTTAKAHAAVVKHVAQHIDDILFGDINAPMTEKEIFDELNRILCYYDMPLKQIEECAHTIMDLYDDFPRTTSRVGDDEYPSSQSRRQD